MPGADSGNAALPSAPSPTWAQCMLRCSLHGLIDDTGCQCAGSACQAWRTVRAQAQPRLGGHAYGWQGCVQSLMDRYDLLRPSTGTLAPTVGLSLSHSHQLMLQEGRGGKAERCRLRSCAVSPPKWLTVDL
jgi:hypothetical protein